MQINVDKEKVAAQAAAYGKQGFGLAVKAGILYVILTVAGFIGGGIGGYWGAAHFDLGAWVAVLSALAGMAAGGFAGFFLAQVVILGIIQDMLLDAGIKTGKVGFKAAMKLLKESKSSGPYESK